MKIVEVSAALSGIGQRVTLRRVTTTGTTRRNTDVSCVAWVQVGGAQVLVGSAQQTADRIILCSAEMDAAAWPKPPRHGDQLIYADGLTVVAIQGRAMNYPVDGGQIFIVQAIG